MLSIYAKQSSLSTRSPKERESSCTHVRNCVYLSKIENSSYHQELVSHPMPECVDELSTLDSE